MSQVGCVSGVPLVQSTDSSLTGAERALADEILAVSPWLSIRKGYGEVLSVADVEAYDTVSKRLRVESVSTLRTITEALLVQAWKKSYLDWVAVSGTLFVLWRISFQLPMVAKDLEEFRMTNLHSGELGNAAVTRLEMRWPGEFTASGKLSRIYCTVGISGTYDALDDFDDLASQFGLRHQDQAKE